MSSTNQQSANSQTLYVPLKFWYKEGFAIPDLPKVTNNNNWCKKLGQQLIQSTSLTIGDDSYEWEPIEGSGIKIKGPRTIEWRCGCGYRILDPIPGLDPPDICPMCQRTHTKENKSANQN